MSPSLDVLIIGGGIVGTAIAEALSRGGRSVTLVSPGPLGGGATAAGMGHIVVMDDSPEQLALTRYSQQRWDRLAAELPAGAEHHRCGTIWVAADEEELQEVRRKSTVYEAAGIATEVLDASALHAHEPQLAADLRGGLRVPGDSVIYSTVAALYLWEQAVSRGAHWIADRVMQLDGHSVQLQSGTTLQATTIINAAGQWAGELMPDLPLRWKKGHLIITDRYPGFVNHQLIELGYLKSAHATDRDSVAFNAQPRSTGQILLGSSRQVTDRTPEIVPEITERMVARAQRYLPGITQLNSLRIWTGHRAATPDNLPLIGPHPGHPAWWVATGHEGLGITTSMGTADLLAAMIEGTPPPLDPAPFALEGRREVSHA